MESGHASANPESTTKGAWSELQDWDIVNLGRLMWQCLNDDPDKIKALKDLKEERVSDECGIGAQFISLMQECFLDARSERILNKIAGLGKCGRETLKEDE